MKNKWMIVIGSMAIIGIIAAILVYFFVYNKQQPDYSVADPDYSLSAIELFKEFKADPVAASEKYNGKVLALEGNLNSVERTDSLTIAVFAIEEGMFGDEGIRFAFIPKYADEISSTPPETSVTIKGFCTGFNDTDIIMEHCSLVK